MITNTQILSIVHREKQMLWKFLGSHSCTHLYGKYRPYEENALLLLSIEKPHHLCKFLRTNFRELEETINNPNYDNFRLAKKRGGYREIFTPDDRLKRCQKQLNFFLQAYYLCIKPSEVHGFVINPNILEKKCNIVENAKVHVKRKHLLNIDLKDFFPGISAKRVKALFSSELFNYNEQISTALTLLTTYQGMLPIGAPTSPVISNFICLQLDMDLKQFSETNSLSYSRYADDITFSTDKSFSTELVNEIKGIIEKQWFEINTKKLHITTSSKKQVVTGLTVNEKVNVDRKLLKKIRAMLHDLNTNGIDACTINHFHLIAPLSDKYRVLFLLRLRGYINFVGQVRGKTDALYLNFKKSLSNIQTLQNT